MIDTTIFQDKTAVYYTLGCKLNFSETSTIGKTLKEAGIRTARKGEKADICVSDAVAEEFQKDFYQFRNHISIMYDIMDKNFILKMAKMKSNVKSDMQKGQYKLLTVGRLDPNKGYDIAIDAAKILRENGINFCWYVLGKGEEYQKIKELIKKNRLEEY